jgi:hypothetical protein
MVKKSSCFILLVWIWFINPTYSIESSEFIGNANFRWDINSSLMISASGDDLAGTGFSHILPTDRLPRNYVGFEYSYFPNDQAWLGKSWVEAMVINPHLEIDFHPRDLMPQTIGKFFSVGEPQPLFYPSHLDQPLSWDLEFGDPPSSEGYYRNMVRFKLLFYDCWIRFKPPELNRTTFRVGHFDIPYGTNPVMTGTRGDFIMPPEMMDVGLKKDWGVSWKGPMGDFDYEISATTGMGLGIHNPRWLDRDYPPSYLFSARIGAPTYWKFQYGISGLYGRVPLFYGDQLLDELALKRWRVSLDLFVRPLHYIAFGGQVGGGQNERHTDVFVRKTQKRNDTIAAHAIVDYVPPWFHSMNIKAQFKTILYEIGYSEWDYYSAVAEIGFSLSNALFLRFDYEHTFRVPRMIGREDDRLYVGLSYFK